MKSFVRGCLGDAVEIARALESDAAQGCSGLRYGWMLGINKNKSCGIICGCCDPTHGIIRHIRTDRKSEIELDL